MDARTYISELKSDLSRYDQMGLIDELSIYAWIEDAMKKFGKLVCERTDCIVDIHNGVGCLPHGFYSFDEAYKCEPIAYTTKKGEDISDLQDEFAWKERTERGFRWNSCDECCKEEYECVITEKFYIKTREVEFHYHRPQKLRLGKKIKSVVGGDKRPKNPDQLFDIEIASGKIYTHFDDGSIYLRYYSTPVDEEGLPIIYDSQLGYVYQFVDSFVKRKTLERIFANGDDPNVITKLQYYLSQEPILERKAMGELKMGDFSLRAYEKLASDNKKKIEIYGNFLPELH